MNRDDPLTAAITRLVTDACMETMRPMLDAAVQATLSLAVDVPTAAGMLSVSPSTIKTLVQDGRLPRLDIHGRILIPRAALEEFVNSAA